MVSATRRLSMTVDDVHRRIDAEHWHTRKGGIAGAVGRWLENELDDQRNMLPGIDNMWLLLQQGSDFNPVCAAIYTFREEVKYSAMLEKWEDMTRRFPAYRQRLTGLHRRFHTAQLAEDPDFSIREHISAERMDDGKNGKRQLEDAMAKLVAKDWDLSRPLWEAKVLYNYCDGTGAKCAMILRAHHTLSDGQGFVVSQLSTTSAREIIEQKLSRASTKGSNHAKVKLSDLPIPAISARLRPLDPFVPSVFVTMLFWALWLVFLAMSVLYGAYALLRAGAMFAMFRRRALRYPGDRPREREFSFSEAISLADIKRVQRAFGSAARRITLNDVMCAVVARTVREYIDQAGEPRDKRIALFIPISIRAPADTRMANQSTGMIAYFPCAPALGTRALISAAHDEMRALKTAFWPRMMFALLEYVYRLPFLVPRGLAQTLMASFHGVLTNVPGPPAPIDIHGAQVLSWTVCPPQAGKGTLGIGMISYDGHLVWTVTADKTAQHAGVARHLTEGFHRTFHEFLAEATQLGIE